MKKYFLTISLIFFAILGLAQKTRYVLNKETLIISRNGVDIAKIVKTKADLIGLSKNFSVRDLNDVEIIYVKSWSKKYWDSTIGKEVNKNMYTYFFNNPAAKATEERGLGLSDKGLVKLMGVNRLLTDDGKLDSDAQFSFITKMGGEYIKKEQRQVSTSIVEVVDKKIIQDDIEIGKVIEQHNETNRIYHVYNNAGTKVVMAIISKVDPIEWQLTKPDGAVYTVLYEGAGDGIQILTYLAAEGWMQ